MCGPCLLHICGDDIQFLKLHSLNWLIVGFLFSSLTAAKIYIKLPNTFQYMKLNCPVLVFVCFLLVLGTCYNISRWYVAICSSINSLFQWASFVLLMVLSKKSSSLWLICSTGTLCNNIFVFIALYWRSRCAISSLILEINYLQPYFDLKSPPKVPDEQCPTFTANVVHVGITRSLVRC